MTFAARPPSLAFLSLPLRMLTGAGAVEPAVAAVLAADGLVAVCDLRQAEGGRVCEPRGREGGRSRGEEKKGGVMVTRKKSIGISVFVSPPSASASAPVYAHTQNTHTKYTHTHAYAHTRIHRAPADAAGKKGVPQARWPGFQNVPAFSPSLSCFFLPPAAADPAGARLEQYTLGAARAQRGRRAQGGRRGAEGAEAKAVKRAPRSARQRRVSFLLPTHLARAGAAGVEGAVLGLWVRRRRLCCRGRLFHNNNRQRGKEVEQVGNYRPQVLSLSARACLSLPRAPGGCRECGRAAARAAGAACRRCGAEGRGKEKNKKKRTRCLRRDPISITQQRGISSAPVLRRHAAPGSARAGAPAVPPAPPCAVIRARRAPPLLPWGREGAGRR